MSAARVIVADLGLERSPYAERGLIVLACIACALGVISVLRWSFRPPTSDRTSGEEERGWPFMRRVLVSMAQAAGGVAIVLVLARLLIPATTQPAGWSLISPPHEVYALALQGDTVWAGGKEGLFAFDRKSGAVVQTPLQSRDLRGVRALLVEDGALWIGCAAGVFRWDGRHADKILPPLQSDTGPISALRRTRDGSLWIGATQGAWRLSSDGTWEWFGEKEGLRLPIVDTIYEDKSGALWFASKEPEAPGLWRRVGDQWTLFDRASGLGHPAINDMIGDGAGTLWIACGFGAAGMAQSLREGKWTSTEVRGLEGRKIRSLYQDGAQRLWFCSEYDGVAILDGGSWRRLTMKEGLPGNEIKVMARDSDGTLWLGNERGLGRIIGFK